MTRLDPRQVVHLLDNKPPEPFYVHTEGCRWGSYGGRSHRWYWKANRHSWFTLCERPQYQSQKEPDGNNTNPCETCGGMEVQGESDRT